MKEEEKIDEQAEKVVAEAVTEVQAEEVVTETETVAETQAEEVVAESAPETANAASEEVTEEENVTVLKGSRQRGRSDRGRKRREQEEKPPSEWTEKVVQIRRVTKVVKGGKKLSFRAVVIVGNQKGKVGVGCAKAAEVIIAIQKAIADGRKNLITVPIFKKSIPHPIVGRSGAGSVMLRPASEGTGIIAGGAVRTVLELAGVENILCKSLGS